MSEPIIACSALGSSGVGPGVSRRSFLIYMRGLKLRIANTMALLDRIQTDMTAAMRAKDEARLNAIRLIKTALKKLEVDSMKPLDENTELQVLNTLIKQRREAADMFRKGGRAELADKEEAELKLIESYMPAAPSEEEIESAIAAALAET